MNKRVTQQHIADLAGVSRQLVSLVSRNSAAVSDSTRRRVLQVMREEGFSPTVQPRVSGRGLVGVVVPDLSNQFFGLWAQSLRAEGSRRGVTVLMVSTTFDRQTEKSAIEELLRIGVDSLVLASSSLELAEIEDYALRVPLCQISRSSLTRSSVSVQSDDYDGGKQATVHLIDQGYSPVVYLGLNRSHPGDSVIERMRGYNFVLEEAGKADESIALHVNLASLRTTAEHVLNEYGPKVGIVAHNDTLALAIINVAYHLGYRPGADFGIVGFDNTQVARLPGAGISSMDQKVPLMCKRVFDLLDKLMGVPGEIATLSEGQRRIVTRQELKIRESSTPNQESN